MIRAGADICRSVATHLLELLERGVMLHPFLGVVCGTVSVCVCVCVSVCVCVHHA